MDIVLLWSIFTTKLELILPKIAEKIQFAPPRRFAALPRRKIAFSFEEKIGARKIKKCKGNFSARLRAGARDGGATLRLGRRGKEGLGGMPAPSLPASWRRHKH